MKNAALDIHGKDMEAPDHAAITACTRFQPYQMDGSCFGHITSDKSTVLCSLRPVTQQERPGLPFWLCVEEGSTELLL